MATGHTGEVCPETGNITTDTPISLKQGQMQQAKDNILGLFLKNHFSFSLHIQKTSDIKSIVKIGVSGIDPRHCSTTFYQ